MSISNNHKPGKIYETSNYDSFKLANNRPLDKKRVEKLKKEIKASDFGSSFPILVDSNGTIRDGQHRFSARKDLNLPIFFHICEQKLNLNAVAKTNSLQQKWNTDDHVLARAHSGQKTFKAIENFAADNNLKPSQALSFFRSEGSSNLRKSILSGEQIELTNSMIGEAQKVLNVWKSFRQFIPKMDFRSAVSACQRLIKTRGYSHERMISQINKMPRRFVPCVDAETYLEMFEEIYNYNYHKQNRLKFVREK